MNKQEFMSLLIILIVGFSGMILISKTLSENEQKAKEIYNINFKKMTNQKPLPQIPKHLADQGVRWVSVCQYKFFEEFRIFLEKTEDGKFKCVRLDQTKKFLRGEIKFPETCIWRSANEIENKEIPKLKAGDRVQFKEWNEMTEEFGRVWHDRQLYASTSLPFAFKKKALCGTYATVVSISSGDVVELKEMSYREKYIGGSLTVACPHSVDMLKLAQEPKEEKCEFCSICHKKVAQPYTAGTFPPWAVWIRDKKDKSWYSVSAVCNSGIDTIAIMAPFKSVDGYEIASSIPDENGNIVWKPFYRLA